MSYWLCCCGLTRAPANLVTRFLVSCELGRRDKILKYKRHGSLVKLQLVVFDTEISTCFHTWLTQIHEHWTAYLVIHETALFLFSPTTGKVNPSWVLFGFSSTTSFFGSQIVSLDLATLQDRFKVVLCSELVHTHFLNDFQFE